MYVNPAAVNAREIDTELPSPLHRVALARTRCVGRRGAARDQMVPRRVTIWRQCDPGEHADPSERECKRSTYRVDVLPAALVRRINVSQRTSSCSIQTRWKRSREA